MRRRLLVHGLWALVAPVLMFAAALMLLGIPTNLGDVYEFCGGLVTAYCCLRTIVSAPRAPALARPWATGPRSAR